MVVISLTVTEVDAMRWAIGLAQASPRLVNPIAVYLRSVETKLLKATKK